MNQSLFPSDSPRPFLARGSRIKRCETCLMPAGGCICNYRMGITAAASFLLLTHRKERFKPTNTGRLIQDTLADTQVFEWNRTEPDQALLDRLNAPDVDPYIVFPEGDDYQERMSPLVAKPGRKPMFIILDGTWRQARRMFRHGRFMDHIPVIQPDTRRTTQYDLRTQQQSHHLCTAEVAVAMLETAGDQFSADVLEAYFTIFNEQYKIARRAAETPKLEAALNLLNGLRSK